MAVAQIEIRSRQPFADGAAFGDVGPYERLDGLIRFAVDPDHPANQRIVDLDKAARDASGRVQFQADFCLLQPVDPARGSGRLLLDVANRGRKRAVAIFNRAAPALVPTEEIDPGDGFLMRRGWTVAWCGWQWDVIRSPALLGLEAPDALGSDGRPIQGQVICQFQPTGPGRDHLLADRVHQPYPAADPADPEAVLTIRDGFEGPRSVIPRDQWRFAHDEDGRPVEDDTHVWLAEGFAPGRIYEVIYRTRICPVVGTGLLAVRDSVAFLRHGEATAGNPCGGRITQTYGFGVSQSGRFLRHFLYLGLNLDEAGRPVFDGLIPHVAGARRGEFNQRFGQPSVQATRSFGHLMPFTDDDQTDPFTGETDGLLHRQRELGGVPRIMTTNTSAEYWRGDCSLIHTDPLGLRDVEPPAETRIYLLAGTQHVSGTLPLYRVGPDGARGAHDSNAVDYTPLMRAILVHLDRWVTTGNPPPPSVFPRLADGTAVRAADVLDFFRAIPGVTVPDPNRLRSMRRLDLGPETAQGIGLFPAKVGEIYPTYVPAVDADGNELGGLRLPDLTVPVATYTGWNPRAPETGGQGQIIDMMGSTFPFPATVEERQRSGDPRRAIAERYPGRTAYLAQVRAAAEQLVGQGYLLAEDVDLVVKLAGERYDAFAGRLRELEVRST